MARSAEEIERKRKEIRVVQQLLLPKQRDGEELRLSWWRTCSDTVCLQMQEDWSVDNTTVLHDASEDWPL